MSSQLIGIEGRCLFPVPETRFPPLLFEVWSSAGKANLFLSFLWPLPRPVLQILALEIYQY